ncbi:MAG: AzlD domain-containing protein [Oscillospiraceae bacterium]|jgi:branched-subunit amino acid transport protein AzlD|nr:AzlD domain-containing protein [Oscillospiraceae bacterium]
MTTLEAIIMVAVFAAATFITRALAFALFPAGKPTPKFVVYLGRVLPFAITAMLVVYCLKNTVILENPHGAPELLAILLVAALFLAFKNSLLAIAVGTVAYMLMVQVLFA